MRNTLIIIAILLVNSLKAQKTIKEDCLELEITKEFGRTMRYNCYGLLYTNINSTGEIKSIFFNHDQLKKKKILNLMNYLRKNNYFEELKGSHTSDSRAMVPPIFYSIKINMFQENFVIKDKKYLKELNKLLALMEALIPCR